VTALLVFARAVRQIVQDAESGHVMTAGQTRAAAYVRRKVIATIVWKVSTVTAVSKHAN
jgi:hypothetical protein